ALLLHDTPDFAYGFFGAIRMGAVAVPLNTLLKPHDYEHLLNDCRARVIMVSEALLPQIEVIPRDRLRYLEQVVVVGPARTGMPSLENLMAAHSPDFEPAATCKDEPAFWLYSSGSTGSPKGCVHLHHDMVVCAELYARQILNIGPEDRCFSVAKLFFAYGLGNALYFPFSVGATSILWPGPPIAAHVYEVIERHRPTLFFSVPTNYAMLLAHRREGADFDLSGVRHAVSAGEALPAALYHRFRERFGVEILDAIGSTEALQMFIANRPGAARPGSSGQVIPGYEARIVDEEGRDLPDGEVGHLLVRGDSICAFYWNQHEKTKATIEGNWLRTGDKYRRDEQGYFWHAGRSDDMLKVGGIWVSPVEIESTLLEHPAVLEAAVVGREDQDRLIKPAAYVSLRPGFVAGEVLATEIREFVVSRIAEYKRPRWVEFLPELPKTATGKIQRFKLRQMAAAGRG
ncbi:MAG TPA: benzoate-CoA ligase family protein, partial [Terriglobales bacterium]|nr:benzoate-CoA ligase family protein [Terriglobales bacterium]